MEFELRADADAVAGLGRIKALAARRDGRARSQGVKIVWHDSPEHALLADGLALTEQRGVWRLERLVPGEDTWLPAQPAPVIAEAPDLATLAPLATLPSPLAPLAALEGRTTSSVHRFGDSTVTLTIDRGTVRSVTAERPFAHIAISGDESAVHEAAQLIAGAIPVSVPSASLAAEAIALATGQKPQARHHGPPVLPGSLTGVQDALSHIIGHLTDVILAFAPLAVRADDVGVNAVHQMRVAVRRARSALAVFRSVVEPGAFDAISLRFESLGAQLGPSRDWDVFGDETIPLLREVLPGDQRVERLATVAGRRRRECRQALTDYLAGVEFRGVGIECAWFAAATSWRMPPADPPVQLDEFSAGVLQHRWRKLISAGKRMEALDIAGLHDVRLRAKRARYAAEMFASLYRGKAAHRFIRQLSALQQRLGVLNDGAVATHLIEELGGASGRHAYAAGVVAGFMAVRAAKIRPRIVLAFEKFRRQPAYWA